MLSSLVLVHDNVLSGALLAVLHDVRLAGDRYTALCRPGRERTTFIREFLDWLEEDACKTRVAPPVGEAA